MMNARAPNPPRTPAHDKPGDAERPQLSPGGHIAAGCVVKHAAIDGVAYRAWLVEHNYLTPADLVGERLTPTAPSTPACLRLLGTEASTKDWYPPGAERNPYGGREDR